MASDTITFPYTTEAYIAHGPSQDNAITLSKITYPSLTPTQILVRILAVSICQSDIKASQGKFHLRPPLIPGHEGSGYVIATGSAVRDVSVGDALVLSFDSCGECRRCRRGEGAYCDELWGRNFGGVEVDVEGGGKVMGGFFGQSSLSRVARCEERCAVKVSGLGLSEGELRMCASLGCGVQTGAGAIWNVAKPQPGSRIAIWGAGAVGLSAILAAKLASPELLVLIDNSETKLATIPEDLLEGVHVMHSAGHGVGETTKQIKALTDDGRGLDVALDCVGNGAVLGEAHASLDKLGMLITVGGSPDGRPEFTIASHLVKGITFRGTHQGDSVPRIMIPQLIKLWKQARFPFDKFQSQYPFDELDRVMEDVKAGKLIKPLLVI